MLFLGRQKDLVVILTLVAGLTFVPHTASVASPGTSDHRPNFLIIVTDDQRYDAFTETYMPKTWARIVRQGILFDRAYVTTSLCSPSRASIFTGLLARHHGVVRNSTKISKSNFDLVPRFSEDLKNAGYLTGLVGKYLNSWDGTWRKTEFNYWVSFPKGQVLDWFNFLLTKNDKIINVSNTYITYKLLSYANEFLNRAVVSGKPFLLYFATTAPHGPATPYPPYAEFYLGLPLYRPESFNELAISDKPFWMQKLPLLTAEQISEIDDSRIKQLQTLASVDDVIDSLMNHLEQTGKLKDTFILFLSDNSDFWGEHRLTGKNLSYEEASHVPFAMRYPRLVPVNQAGIQSKKLVANIDIAPTLYELAGLPIPIGIDGRSLVPLLVDPKAKWRNKLILEGWPDTTDGDGSPETCSTPYTAVHTPRYVYVESHSNTGTGATPECTFVRPDKAELYDFKNDPLQLENRSSDPEYVSVQDKLKKLLDRYAYVAFPH